MVNKNDCFNIYIHIMMKCTRTIKIHKRNIVLNFIFKENKK